MNKTQKPKYLGPGTWYVLHTMAANAVSKDEKKAFLILVDILKTKLFCKKCQDHFNEFILIDNPSKYINTERGLFDWSWRCHNNANQITGKQLMSYEDAVELYYNTEICTAANCDEEEKKEPEINQYSFIRLTGSHTDAPFKIISSKK